MDMKHLFFKSLLIALLVLFAGGGISAADKTETIYFYQLYDNGDVVETVEGTDITITFNKGNNSNAPKYFSSGDAIRAYGGNYFTVTAYGNKITKIVIGFGSPGDGSNSITTNGGTYNSNGTWTGNAESVTFTVGGSSGNRRIASIAVTYDFEQGQGTLDPQNSFANATENATVGEPYTVQEITTLSKGRKRYKSSDVSVATIDGSGKVTLKKAGETTITVTTAADDTYQEGSASYTLIVSKGTPTLSFALDIVNLIIDEDFTPSLTNPSGVEVTYSIDDPAIAELQNKNTGYLKALKVGTATVRATSVENGSYLSAEATFTLVVSEKLSAEGSYKLVKDASTLAAGDELVIVYQTNDTFAKVMGNQQTNNFKYVDVRYSTEFADRSIINISSGNVAPIMLEGSEGAWYFRTNNGYLYAASSSNNQLKTTNSNNTLDEVGDNAKATISISSGGDATILFRGKNTRKLIKYNSQDKLFSCYESNNSTNYIKLVQIYRKIQKSAVSFADPVVEITYGDNYDKQKATVEGFSGNLVYTSSDESVVKFHGNGVIDVLGPGTATITATAPATDITSKSNASYTLKIYEPADDHEINLTFSSAGYLTWVATADIDFSQTDGVTAYQITEATSKKITMVEVDKVPKGAAVMLKGSSTKTLKRTTGVEPLSNNKMQPCADASVTGNGNGVTNTDVYVLGNGKSGLGFYMLKGTLQAGKGYLIVTESESNAKDFIGFEVTTGVNTVEANGTGDAAIYNLQGIRVAHPQKGIYVKNGKKYVIK